MATKFPFAKYFGEVNILAALQFPPDEKPYFDHPPADPEQKDFHFLTRSIMRSLPWIVSQYAVGMNKVNAICKCFVGANLERE